MTTPEPPVPDGLVSAFPPPPLPVLAVPDVAASLSEPAAYVTALPLIEELLPAPFVLPEAAPPAPPPPPPTEVAAPAAPLEPYPVKGLEFP